MVAAQVAASMAAAPLPQARVSLLAQPQATVVHSVVAAVHSVVAAAVAEVSVVAHTAVASEAALTAMVVAASEEEDKDMIQIQRKRKIILSDCNYIQQRTNIQED